MQFTIERLVELISKPRENSEQQTIYDKWVDTVILAGTLDGEGRSESVLGRLAIGCTIRNRRAEYPADKGKRYWEVCLRRLQYSCWWESGGKENYERTLGIQQYLFYDGGVRIDPRHTEARRRFDESIWIAEGIIGYDALDPTNRATHYITKTLFHSAQCPLWASADKVCALIEHHVFFRGVK